MSPRLQRLATDWKTYAGLMRARLFWGRLRGRFHYGEQRRLTLWSVLRFLRVAAIVAGIIAAGWWLDRGRQRGLAGWILAGVSLERHDGLPV